MVCRFYINRSGMLTIQLGSDNSGGVVETQRGSGEDDGIYRHVGTSKGIMLTFADASVEDQAPRVFFADLVSPIKHIPY